MNKHPNHAITLTVIYLALISLCLAIYALIIMYIDTDKQSLIVDLLSWSATLFATIALLFTVNNWKVQKKAEILSNLSNQCSRDLGILRQSYDDLTSRCLNILNGASEYDIEKKYILFNNEYELNLEILLKIQTSKKNKNLEAYILIFSKQMENNKSAIRNVIHDYEMLNNDMKSNLRVFLVDSSGKTFSLLNKIKIELISNIFNYD